MNIPFTSRDHVARPNRITYYLAAIALSMSLCLGGCGDRHEDSTAAKTASNQGKPDNAPWDGSRWHGDKQHWQRDIDARAQNQNEYLRIPN
jgi:hypothetical protein